MYVNIYMYICIFGMYIYLHTYIDVHIYIYIYVYHILKYSISKISPCCPMVSLRSWKASSQNGSWKRDEVKEQPVWGRCFLLDTLW